MQPLRDLSRRILVVDDDESIVDLVSTRLMIGGYNVVTAPMASRRSARSPTLSPRP